MESLSQQIYSRDGFISVGFRFSRFKIGDEIPPKFEDGYLNKYRWRVIGPSTADECRSQIESMGVKCHGDMDGRIFYRIEAMD